MKTIIFNCPNCGFVCAFREKYAGRAARCLRCDERFTIPQDGLDAERIKTARQFDEPLPGFYEAVLKNSWRVIFSQRSFTVISFVMLLATFKFFTGHLDFWIKIPANSGGTVDIPVLIGSTIQGIVWGALFYCYAEIVYATSFDTEYFEPIYFGGGFGFFAAVVKSLYCFLVSLLFVLLPCIILTAVFRVLDIELKWPLKIFAFAGLFFFPMVLLVVSVGHDLTMIFNPDNYYTPIKKAFRPYLLVAGIFVIMAYLLQISKEYGDIADKSFLSISANLAYVFVVQVLILFAMRTIGLFHRHYNCYFNW